MDSKLNDAFYAIFSCLSYKITASVPALLRGTAAHLAHFFVTFLSPGATSCEGEL
jgi:hypothetical protein